MGYGAVLAFADGAAGRRSSLVSFFKDTDSALNAWWDRNKDAATSSVPNLTEPSLGSDPKGMTAQN